MGARFFNHNTWRPVKSMTNAADKRALLSLIYNEEVWCGKCGTPTLGAFDRIMEYFRTTGSSAPILPAADGGECQQNFAVVVTDGKYKDKYNDFPRNRRSEPNRDGDNNTPFDGGLYADGWGTTLADKAMYTYETDLRPDLDNNVPTISALPTGCSTGARARMLARHLSAALSTMPREPAWAHVFSTTTPGVP